MGSEKSKGDVGLGEGMSNGPGRESCTRKARLPSKAKQGSLKVPPHRLEQGGPLCVMLHANLGTQLCPEATW